MNTRRSTRHNSPLPTVSTLQQFSRHSDFSSLLKQLLTPERNFFFTPATSHTRAKLLLYSSDFLRQSESSSLLQRLLTPERIFFFTPATSYTRVNLLLYSRDFSRQSESSSLLQQLLTPERNFFLDLHFKVFPSRSFRSSKIFSIFTVLDGLDDAVTLLPLFFYAIIS